MALFKGFSTVGRRRAPFSLTNQTLVKQDLLNEFYTRRGERFMRPNFGSIIWDLLMNPLDEYTQRAIRDDIERIVGRDPRVRHINTELFVSDHAVRAEVALEYVKLNTADVLLVEFQRNITEGNE
jgi:phage baseplate assembly protein W